MPIFVLILSFCTFFTKNYLKWLQQGYLTPMGTFTEKLYYLQQKILFLFNYIIQNSTILSIKNDTILKLILN